MILEERRVLLDQRLDVGVEVGGRHLELVGPADARRHRVGEVLVGADDLDAGEVDGLARQVRQLLLAIDLRAPLGEDLFEVGEGLVVGGERVGLLLGERRRLGTYMCGEPEGRRADQRQGDDGGGEVTRCWYWPIEAHEFWSLTVVDVRGLFLPLALAGLPGET